VNPYLEGAPAPTVSFGDGNVVRVLDDALDEVLYRSL
jgi:hypothetical protein